MVADPNGKEQMLRYSGENRVPVIVEKVGDDVKVSVGFGGT